MRIVVGCVAKEAEYNLGRFLKEFCTSFALDSMVSKWKSGNISNVILLLSVVKRVLKLIKYTLRSHNNKPTLISCGTAVDLFLLLQIEYMIVFGP